MRVDPGLVCRSTPPSDAFRFSSMQLVPWDSASHCTPASQLPRLSLGPSPNSGLSRRRSRFESRRSSIEVPTQSRVSAPPLASHRRPPTPVQRQSVRSPRRAVRGSRPRSRAPGGLGLVDHLHGGPISPASFRFVPGCPRRLKMPLTLERDPSFTLCPDARADRLEAR